MISSLLNSISIWLADRLPRDTFSRSWGVVDKGDGSSCLLRFFVDSLPLVAFCLKVPPEELFSNISPLPAFLSLSLDSRKWSNYSSWSFDLSSSLKTYKFGFTKTVASAEVGKVLGIDCGLSSVMLEIVSIFGKASRFFAEATCFTVLMGKGLVNESQDLLAIASLTSATSIAYFLA
jgi:hypothetical protein